MFFFQAEDGIRYLVRSRGLGDVYKRQLYKRATGFSYEEEVLHVIKGEVVRSVVTKHVIPDPWSAHKWLSARQPQLWTDTSKSEITHTNININKFDFNGLSTEELKLVERIGLRQIAQNIALG